MSVSRITGLDVLEALFAYESAVAIFNGNPSSENAVHLRTHARRYAASGVADHQTSLIETFMTRVRRQIYMRQHDGIQIAAIRLEHVADPEIERVVNAAAALGDKHANVKGAR